MESAVGAASSRPPTFPWGKVAPQGPEEGRYRVRVRTAPHPSRLRPATLSQERVF